jgi:hypothetical protein
MPSLSPHIHFVKTDVSTTWPDVEQFDERDVDTLELAPRLRGGTNSWLIQTYLQLGRSLREAGVACSIGERFVRGAVNIAHRDTLSRFRWVYPECYVVGIRADRAALRLCDFEVLQNEIEPDDAEHIGIPLWPQPGLMPRSRTRGRGITTIAYFGRTGTAAKWLQGPEFLGALGQLGTRFEIREERWFDYQDVDLILAHRLEAPVMLENKPPSKLINAWLAGTPAMLGDEPAFVNLRRSSLDYLSIASPRDVIAAVKHLKGEDGVFEAMVANGLVRGVEYNAAALRQRWLELLLNRILPRYLAGPREKRLSSRMALLRAFLEQRRLTQEFRQRYKVERLRIESVDGRPT